METRRTDVAIIGAGTAGLNARREVEKAGRDWLLIESGPYGTTCARVGCMPSKLLIAAAESAHAVAGAARFGIEVPAGWHADGRAVMARVRRLRDRFASGVVQDTEALPAARRLRGHARFVDATTLEVGDAVRVEAQAVVVATGSWPHIPAPFDAVRDRIITSEEVFELEDLPASLAVIGTGVLGLELGQALHRLGVATTFFNPVGRMGPVTDPAVAEEIRGVLGRELDLQLESEVRAAMPIAAGMRLAWKDAAGEPHQRDFARVLVAAGRRPRLAGLALERTGLALDNQGVPGWNPRTMQCGELPIFLAGDVSGHLPLLHEAGDEGRIAGRNAAAWPEVGAHERRAPLVIAFTDPQIAMAGCRYDQLDCRATEIGEVFFEDQGRSRVMGVNRGILRVYGDHRHCRVVGAEMFGPQAEHLAHLLAWVIQRRLRVSKILELPFYHPTVEEGLRTALRSLAKKLGLYGECRPEDMAVSPGA